MNLLREYYNSYGYSTCYCSKSVAAHTAFLRENKLTSREIPRLIDADMVVPVEFYSPEKWWNATECLNMRVVDAILYAGERCWWSGVYYAHLKAQHPDRPISDEIQITGPIEVQSSLW